ncbi:MAG: hypothetical protein AAF517_19135, partial [Planctomycetota bacterium]
QRSNLLDFFESYDSVRAAFQKRGGTPEILKVVEKFYPIAERDESFLEAFRSAIGTRLNAYGKTFESNAGGRILAKILDKTTPDFELEGLDGKKHKFRELTKGKVTLLSFWGYG